MFVAGTFVDGTGVSPNDFVDLLVEFSGAILKPKYANAPFIERIQKKQTNES